MRNSFALIIPTYNAANFIEQQLTAINQQSVRPQRILFIDSSSTDKTVQLLDRFEMQYHLIKQDEFNHGATRQLALTIVDADIYLYMTQDAIPANEHAFENLLKAFEDESIGCAYGRQLPNKNSTVLGTHARLFNYPPTSEIRGYQDVSKYGIKTCFNSDCFAAYRKSALLESGGFPANIILSEDVYVAAKMLMNGWKIAYRADAEVYHSHDYSISDEFRRYFDIGVFHRCNRWLIESFGSPNLEGFKYMYSELSYCIKHRAYLAVLEYIFRVAAKYIGYQLGANYQRLPEVMVRSFSMHKSYWDKSLVKTKV